jgi:hypothetical protein
MKRFLLVALFTGAAFAQGTIEIRRSGKVVATDHDRSTDAVRVLFIGNSLTFWNEMPWMTRRVSGSLGSKLVTEFSGAGGATLRQHWERGAALRAIKQRRWDFVVLQAQTSEMSTRPEETTNYARLFDREIDRAGAKTVIFATWRIGNTDLTARYVALAHDLDAALAPIGSAWETLQRNGLDLLDPGGIHPNLRGSYLSACVFYATFFGKSPEGATHSFETKFDIPESYRHDLEYDRIDAATAEAIQRTAWKAVQAFNR